MDLGKAASSDPFQTCVSGAIMQAVYGKVASRWHQSHLLFLFLRSDRFIVDSGAVWPSLPPSFAYDVAATTQGCKDPPVAKEGGSL